ncbi:MAG: amidohydrolase family protein, partial [Proteobacteria bacterium]|nr:amidohydrolase family protein [Pseudomonadota bacterium]
HGTFAKIIEKYVMQTRLLTLREAVAKMTSFPAALLRLEDRGIIKENMIADLLIFDPRNVHDNAIYPDPLQLAEGFEVVIVNGKIAREDGRQAADLFGRVLQPHAIQ